MATGVDLSLVCLLGYQMKLAAKPMASAAKVRPCDYLYPYPSSQAFASDRAEFVHINEQISSLDNHISQLTTLRHALHRRSCQLHNLLSPILTLPVEVLSYIFQKLVNPGSYDYPDIDRYSKSLGQAFILGSVSSHFRHVALGTPELWNKVALYIFSIKTIGKASYFLRHSIALAPSVNISVYDVLDEEIAPSTVNILLTPDVMQKLKTFELYESVYATNYWIDRLKASDCPMLDTLSIRQILEPLAFDLGTLTTVTRLSIQAPYLEHSSIVPPPSLQYLHIHDVPQQALVSLLYQCPNLVECIVDIDTPEVFEGSNGDTQFTKPLTLAHLKQFTSTDIDAIMMNQSAENFQLPSLEFLKLEFSGGTKLSSIVLLCRNVSATLTTLIINTESNASNDDDLYRLCQIPFTKLKRLEFHCFHLAPFLSIMRALSTLNYEPNDSTPHYIPTLRTIMLNCVADMQPHYILDLLKEWKIDKTVYVHIQVHHSRFSRHDWSPNLREELRSIVGSRQIEITWHNYKVEDDSL